LFEQWDGLDLSGVGLRMINVQLCSIKVTNAFGILRVDVVAYVARLLHNGSLHLVLCVWTWWRLWLACSITGPPFMRAMLSTNRVALCQDWCACAKSICLSFSLSSLCGHKFRSYGRW
jgi:hypothetical protein